MTAGIVEPLKIRHITASTVPFVGTTSDNVSIGAVTPNEQLEITGKFRLPATTGIIIISGADLFIHNFGLENFLAGMNAGNLTMTDSGNFSAGEAALSSNSTGFDNTAIGSAALISNTTGVHHTATGQGLLGGNTTGKFKPTTGQSVLDKNIAGKANTANDQAGLSNTTGEENSAAEFLALFFNTISVINTATGSRAFLTNTTGSDDTAIGHNANISQGDLTNATAIGANAIVDDSNKIQLGDDNVTEVQITATPSGPHFHAPPSAEYDEASERGRMKVDNVAGTLYICLDSGWVSK